MITCPTIVMVGRQDSWSSVPQHVEIASQVLHAQLIIIEESGHMSPVEQPNQVSTSLLRWLGLEYLTEASRPSAAQ
jgi:pimeloyl-ACP methyl ester carboxylesterase